MTEQKTAQSQPQEASEAEIAAAIALILAGQVVVASVAASIGALLKLIPGLPDVGDADISEPVSRMVSGIGRNDVKGLEANLAASASNLSHRAHYAIEATKRIAQKVAGGDGIAEALSTERTYLQRHIEASETRANGAALNEAAAKRFGPVLSWNHAASRTGASNHRPSHVAADGANFDIRRPPAVTEGMLPGMALHCDCLPGAPIAGARMLT